MPKSSSRPLIFNFEASSIAIIPLVKTFKKSLKKFNSKLGGSYVIQPLGGHI